MGLWCCFQQEEEVKMKAKEDELLKVFQTTVSLCVHNGLMTPERAQSYYRSGEIDVYRCVCVLARFCSITQCVRLSSPRRRSTICSGQLS